MNEPARKPCSDCPWRKDTPTEYWHPDHFRDIYRNCQDDGINLMLCHHASKLPECDRNTLPCQGWVRVMQYDSVGVRLGVMRGLIKVEEVFDSQGPELYETFESMMEANKVKCPKRNRSKEE